MLYRLSLNRLQGDPIIDILYFQISPRMFWWNIILRIIASHAQGRAASVGA